MLFNIHIFFFFFLCCKPLAEAPDFMALRWLHTKTYAGTFVVVVFLIIISKSWKNIL